jgi:hypothetical protein
MSSSRVKGLSILKMQIITLCFISMLINDLKFLSFVLYVCFIRALFIVHQY